MTTAVVMISDALAEIGVLGDGETANGDMLDRGLRMLNRMLETQSNLRAFDFTSRRITHVTANEASFDIGPTGDVVTTRPIKIESATATRGGIEYPVAVIDVDQWDAISYKSATGSIPECIYYDGAYPDGLVYLYPVTTGATLNIRVTSSVKVLAAYDDLDLPEGYEDALMLALAVRMCPSYGRPVSKETLIAARNAMNVVKRTNRTIKKLKLPAVMTDNGSSGLAAIYKG